MNNHPDRRSCDHPDGHTSPCESLQTRLEVEAQILAQLKKLDTIEKNQADMMEMLTAWNNAKGFVATMKTMGGLILWLVGFGAAMYALGEAIKHWVRAG